MRPKFLGVLVAATFAISACASGSGPASNPATDSPSGELLQITVGTDTGSELKFDPVDVTAQPGVDVRLTFENRSEVPHNLTFEAPINAASSTLVAPATSETLEFTAPGPGEYAFLCTIHPGMDGILLVAAS